MVKQTSILWTVVMGLGILSWMLRTGTQGLRLRVYTANSEADRIKFPLGTTVVLQCTASELPQKVQYKWTCNDRPCDNKDTKIYNNVIVIVVTNTTATDRRRYQCGLGYKNGTTFGSVRRTTKVTQTSSNGTLALYNNSKLLLQNTLITDPQQIPNGLKCVTGSSGSHGMFRFEDGTTINTGQGQSTTIQKSQLNQNGQYQCTDGGSKWPFHIFFNNATLPTPQISLRSTPGEQQFQLQLNTPEGYNSGRFILRYDCKFRGIGPIEVEYKSVNASSDRIVTRNRSCFVEGQISTVTVWFVDGRNISSEPAVANATSGEVTGGGESDSSSSRSVLPSATMALPSSLQTLPSSSLPQTPDALTPIIGAVAGGIILLLVSVLGIIICTITIVKTRRGKRNRTTLHDQPVLYTTLQAGEQDVHEYTLPTGEHQQDNYNTGGLYDDVDVKLPQTSIPLGCEEYKDTTDKRYEEQRKGIKTGDNKMKKQDVQDPELLYAEVDKPKKKKGKEKTIEEKEHPVDTQGEILYAEVNKPKKKGKKDKKAKVPQLIEQKQPSPPPDTGLGYEPSADSDSTPQQQDGEGNTTQPTPSATVEGLYAEVDKTQKKNKKKDEE